MRGDTPGSARTRQETSWKNVSEDVPHLLGTSRTFVLKKEYRFKLTVLQKTASCCGSGFCYAVTSELEEVFSVGDAEGIGKGSELFI